MKRLEVRGAVRPIYGSLGVKRLSYKFLHLSGCWFLLVSVENTGQENVQPVDQEINLFQELHLPHVI